MAEELSERIKEAVERAEHTAFGLGNIVAILVALAATFLALVSVKDRNITLRMNQAQAKAIDTWNYYQSKSMKQNLAEATLDELSATRVAAPAAAASDLDKRIANYEKQVKRYRPRKGRGQGRGRRLRKTL